MIDDITPSCDLFLCSLNSELFGGIESLRSVGFRRPTDFMAIFRCARFIRKNGSMVLSNGDIFYDFILGIICFFLGVKFKIFRPVVTEDLIHLSWFKLHVYRLMSLFSVLVAKEVIFCYSGSFDRCNRLERLVVKAKYAVIYNGVEANNDYDLSSKGESIDVGMAAHLSSFKGWDDFLRIANHFQDMKVVNFHVFGDGDLWNDLVVAKQRGQYPNVNLHGYVANITDHLRPLAVYLHTSKREGLSVAIIQAMHARLPIYCFDVGGNRELVRDGVNGRIVDARDLEGLMRALRNDIGQPGRLAEYGDQSKRLAQENFEYTTMLNKYLELLS